MGVSLLIFVIFYFPLAAVFLYSLVLQQQNKNSNIVTGTGRTVNSFVTLTDWSPSYASPINLIMASGLCPYNIAANIWDNGREIFWYHWHGL